MARQPAFVQLDPAALEKQAIDYNTQGYALSDADAYARLGQLYPARDYAVANAASDLAGRQDPIYNSAFKQSGLGPINLGSNAYQQAENLRQPILSLKDRNRTYFADLWKENPERNFGLSTSDVAHIALSNTGNKTAFDQAIFGINTANANAQTAANAQLLSTIGQGIGSIGKTAASLQPDTTSASNYSSPTINPSYYNYTPTSSSYGTIDPNTYVAPAGSDVAGAYTVPENPNTGSGW